MSRNSKSAPQSACRTAILALGLLVDLGLHAGAKDAAAGHLLVFIGMLTLVASVTSQGLRTGNTRLRERTSRTRAHR